MKPRLLCLLAVLAAATGLTACGKKDDDATGAPAAAKLSLALDYLPNADHVGIYAAQARGDFRRAGLDLQIQTPSDPTAPLKLLQAGKVDLAISYEPDLLIARDKGATLVAVDALANQPLTSLMTLSKKITSPADLKGKTVGTAGIPYQSAYLKTILQANGVDPSTVKEVNVGFDLVPAMVSKKVDATLGAFWNVEGVQLQQDKRKPTIIRMDKVGVPTYDELVVVARQDFLAHNGALVRRFVQALQAGTRAVEKDPSVGVDPLVKAANGLDRDFAMASVQATLPALLPAKGKPFGWLDSPAWGRFSAWMARNKLISHEGTDAAITNEFLPGQGVIANGGDAGGGF
jgi:putative hydroxymethylpyrimidine transport system substrate-binding protein